MTVQICREELFWEMKIMSKDDDGYEEDHTYRSGVGPVVVLHPSQPHDLRRGHLPEEKIDVMLAGVK